MSSNSLPQSQQISLKFFISSPPSKQRQLPSAMFRGHRVDPKDFRPDPTSLGQRLPFFPVPMPKTLIVKRIIVSTQEHRTRMLVQHVEQFGVVSISHFVSVHAAGPGIEQIRRIGVDEHVLAFVTPDQFRRGLVFDLNTAQSLGNN
jgi:hypothetical protein